ncbi:MAG: hypothetical protein RL065_1878 [Bacteroidota bacterium]
MQEKPKPMLGFSADSFQTLIDSAKSKKRIIMIECTADWCLPCKQMEKYTFTDSVLIKYAKKNLICKKWDASSFDDFDLLTKYKVEKFPTILFLSFEGKEISRLMGFQTAKNIMDASEKIYHPRKIFPAKKFTPLPKK